MSERKKFDKAFKEQKNMIIWYYIFERYLWRRTYVRFREKFR